MVKSRYLFLQNSSSWMLNKVPNMPTPVIGGFSKVTLPPFVYIRIRLFYVVVDEYH